jgi:hypothetical protein
MGSPTKFEDPRSNPFRRKHCGPIEARNSLKSSLSGQLPAPKTAGDGLLRLGQTWIEADAAILKIAAQITITDSRLVDIIVLEGVGLPTAGFDARSKSPTDPTAQWRVSRSNLRGDADFLTTK